MSVNFQPQIWPEIKPPLIAETYLDCELCMGNSRLVWAEGNPQAPIMVILDNPGAREDQFGQAYVCGTRQTLQQIIHQVDLDAGDIYLTYLLKCRPLGRYNKPKVREFSKPFLWQQIRELHPQFIVCLGDVVVQTMFENPETSVKKLRGCWQELLGRATIVSYHPLAVRRRPNLGKIAEQDWQMLAQRFKLTNN